MRGGTERVENHVSRSTGRRSDRNSKVSTARGLRDRRVRLSAATAIQFYDVQDRLGYDRPSKAVDWLISKARIAIEKLKESPGLLPEDGCCTPTTGDSDEGTPPASGFTGFQLEDAGESHFVKSCFPAMAPGELGLSRRDSDGPFHGGYIDCSGNAFLVNPPEAYPHSHREQLIYQSNLEAYHQWIQNQRVAMPSSYSLADLGRQYWHAGSQGNRFPAGEEDEDNNWDP